MREMAQSERLDFIAEGLTIILTSARGFWNAAEKLTDNPREASVLEGFAEEESAKALILLDLVRCPPSKVDGRIGRIVKNFYSHLARLIYAKAQSWRPVNVEQLQDYVDSERQGHYLEGGMSEYILPNWASPQGLCARQRFGGHNENTGYATSLRRAMGSLRVRNSPGESRFALCHR
nr:hypothetical protein BV87_11380 [Sphingobium yanoikuyae]